MIRLALEVDISLSCHNSEQDTKDREAVSKIKQQLLAWKPILDRLVQEVYTGKYAAEAEVTGGSG